MCKIKLIVLTLFLVSAVGCYSPQLKLEDVPLPKTAVELDLWRNENHSDRYNDYMVSKYIKADKEILRILKLNSKKPDNAIFLLNKTATPESVAAFYDEQLGKQDYRRVLTQSLTVSQTSLFSWHKKQWSKDQSVAAAVIDIAEDADYNLLVIYAF